MDQNSALFNDGEIVYTVPQLKGRRLRMVRALTGFSRQELYQKIGIATSTIDTWESGRVELTEKSAVRVCEAFQKVGIFCTSEWLLTGTGNPPRIMKDIEKSVPINEAIDSKEFSANDIFKSVPFLDEDIRRELNFFVNLHKNTLFHIVEEDFMNSRFKKSDCVAGEIEDIQNLEGRIIIAKVSEEKTVLCKLLRNCPNQESEVFFGKNTPNKKIKIMQAADVIWHRMVKR